MPHGSNTRPAAGPATESQQQEDNQHELPFTNEDAVREDFWPAQSSPQPMPRGRIARPQSALSGPYISSSYGQKNPSRSFTHQASRGSQEPVQYPSQSVREQTQELASWAVGDAGSLRDRSTSSMRFAASDADATLRLRGTSFLSDSDNTDARTSFDSSRPEAIEEASEPVSPDETTPDADEENRVSALTGLFQRRPRRGARAEEVDKGLGGNVENQEPTMPKVVVDDVDATEATEATGLLTGYGIPKSGGKQKYGSVQDIEDRSIRKPRILHDVRGNIAGAWTVLVHPKTWDGRAIWRNGVVEPVRVLPPVFLGWLLNVLDGLSYGMILFPLDKTIFKDTGPDGLSMFFVSTIVSQLVYSLGGSSFKGGVGSEMIEVVPFFHQMTHTIMKQMRGASPQAIMATVILSYSLSSIITGIIFLLLGAFKLGRLIHYLPRSLLTGCIGGVGLFLVLTGIEVSAGLKKMAFDLKTLEELFRLETFILWVLPLLLAIVLKSVQRFTSSIFLIPIFFTSIAAIFYFLVLAIPQLDLPLLRAHGWIFQLPETGVPFYRFYTYYDFGLTDWSALLHTLPTMFALSFFGIIHVPINVPALALAVQQDDVDTDRELLAHGVSNTVSGFAGSIQNYLVYANSQMFIRNGGNSRLAGLLLAAVTLATWIAGPTLIGYIPTCLVGTLIYHLGIELMEEALWQPLGKIFLLEYLMIAVIVIVMGLFDFVVGIVVGIILAFLVYVLQTSHVSAIRAQYPGTVAESTVRRHPMQRRYLREAGRQIAVIKLSGFLFFGTIDAVESKMRAMVDEEAFSKQPIRYLILDFANVDGLDFSAAEAFSRIHRMLLRKAVELVLSGVSVNGKVGKSLQMVGLLDEPDGDGSPEPPKVFEDLNGALEYCENGLLVALRERTEMLSAKRGAQPVAMAIPQTNNVMSALDAVYGSPRRDLLQEAAKATLQEHEALLNSKWQSFAQPLPLILQTFQDLTDKDIDFWHRATPFFSRREFQAGQLLYRRGDEPDGFYLLEQGMLRAEYDFEQGSFSESIVQGTTCGELPFFSGTNRTSTVIAEKDCVAWLLTKEKWQELEKELPDVANELLKIGLRLTSERMAAITSYVLVTAG